MVNPFRCKVLHKKASPRGALRRAQRRLFDKAERRIIAEHIPWTRVVEERKTLFHGETVDLLPWMEANRERFVLKPNDDYGGPESC